MSNSWNGLMTFGAGGDYRRWAGIGWSAPEQKFTWIEGYQATLEFSMAVPDSDPVLEATIMPLKSDQQQMIIYLNGSFVSVFVSNARDATQVALIDRDYFKGEGEKNTLAFYCPNALIPTELGIGPDLRRLSFAFMMLSLHEA